MQLPFARMIQTPRTKTTFIFFLLLLLAALAINLRMVAPYMLSVLMGGILATLARPLFQRLVRAGWREKWAAAAVLLAIAVGVVGPLGGFATAAIHEGIEFGQRLRESKQLRSDSLLRRAAEIPLVNRFLSRAGQDPERLEAQLRSGLQTAGAKASAVLLGILGRIPNLLLQIVLALITCFFVLLDGKRFVGWLHDKLPLDRDVRTQFYDALSNTAVSVIWATLAAAGTQAAVMFLGYSVLGLPAAYLAAGATFIFAWIPMIGSTPIWVIGAIALYTKGAILKMVLMVAIGLFTSIIDNIVRAYVLRGRNEMHPLVSLVAIFGGIQMFGLFGVFFGPILAAVLVALLQAWPSVLRRTGLHPEEAVVAVEVPAAVVPVAMPNAQGESRKEQKRSKS